MFTKYFELHKQNFAGAVKCTKGKYWIAATPDTLVKLKYSLETIKISIIEKIQLRRRWGNEFGWTGLD